MKWFIVSLVVSVAGSVYGSGQEEAALDVNAARERLAAGNARYAARETSAPQPVLEQRAATAAGQQPFAIVLSCADSRVPPELLFDQGIGDLFVIRNAGNLVDDYVLGSIEYAVEHLGTRLIVVLGHERCGAVTAALASDSAPGHVQSIVREIQPAVASVAEVDSGERLDAAIASNARRVADQIKSQGNFGEATEGVVITTAVYDLNTGLVQWLD